MYVALKEYLAQVEALEATRPIEQRRPVPSIVELAKVVGIHPITMSDIANNHVIRFNLNTGAAIIDEMRRRGFSMEVSDLLMSQRRWGRARCRRLLLSLGLPENKQIGTLTTRQRQALAAVLSAKAGANRILETEALSTA